MNVQSRQPLALQAAFVFGVLLAGGDDGVFYTLQDEFGTWLEFGADSLPNAPVVDLVYDPYDDILVAGLQGRGAWVFDGFAASLIPEPGGLLAIMGVGLLLLRRHSAAQRITENHRRLPVRR